MGRLLLNAATWLEREYPVAINLWDFVPSQPLAGGAVQAERVALPHSGSYKLRELRYKLDRVHRTGHYCDAGVLCDAAIQSCDALLNQAYEIIRAHKAQPPAQGETGEVSNG